MGALRPAFVGRERELGELRAAVDHAVGGEGRVFLVSGEPGIGKTRLCDEVGAEASRKGARVVWGRCLEGGGAPPFWPWVQILRAYAERCSPTALAAELAAVGPILAQIVPELFPVLPHLAAAAIEGDSARFLLFDAVTAFLRNGAAEQPMVLVLDDLHAIDVPSLLLLRFLARGIGDSRLLVIATFRDAEVAQLPTVTELVGELGRDSHRIVLNGLSVAEVEHLIASRLPDARRKSTPELVASVREATGGNPFFVDEVLRLFWESADDGTIAGQHIPHQVREAVRRHLRPLRAEARHVLSVAALLGREFDPVAIAPVCGWPADKIDDALADALGAGLILARPRGRRVFRHALIRETLCEELPSSERTARHHAIGNALESLYASDLDAHSAEIAYHFARAGAGGARRKAIAHSRRAGERALGLLAYEEASAHFARSLEMLAAMGDHDRALKCQLLLALGDSYNRSGALAEARPTFLEAAELARKLGTPEQLAVATLGFGGLMEEGGVVREQEVALLEESLSALGDRDSNLRARLLSRLAIEMVYGEPDRARTLAANAVQIAHRTGDVDALAAALHAQHAVLMGPFDLTRRLEVATDLIQVGKTLNQSEITFRGHYWRIVDLLEMADVARTDVEIDAQARAAEESRLPGQRYWAAVMRTMRVLLSARFGEAEQMVLQAFSLGLQAQDPNAGHNLGVQIFVLRWHQGRLEELEQETRESVDRYPRLPVWRSGLALVLSELGRRREAENELHRLASHDFADMPRTDGWLATLNACAEVSASVNDARCAAILYDLLLPFAERNLVLGDAVACVGSLSHSLGLLAATMSRWKAAARHFEDALAMHLEMGAPALVARTEYAYGAMLLRDHSEANASRARVLLTRALEAATALGMKSLEEKLPNLIDQRPGFPVPAGRYICRREGDYWTFTYDGTAVRLRESRGVAYLAHLLWHPGRDFHVNELVDLVAGRDASGTTADADLSVTAGTGDAGPVIDGAARAAYGRRVAVLREEIDDAERANDSGRAALLQAELDAIAHQLRSTIRGRRAAAASERARIAVTKGIGSALARIRTGHPALGRHLEATVKRGYSCSYVPDPRHPIEWER